MKNKTLAILIVLVAGSVSLPAQDLPATDTVCLAEYFNIKAGKLFMAAPDSSAYYAQQAIYYYEAAGLWEEYVKNFGILLSLANKQGDIESYTQLGISNESRSRKEAQ